jgi:hypothetical protein
LGDSLDKSGNVTRRQAICYICGAANDELVTNDGAAADVWRSVASGKGGFHCSSFAA